MVQNKWEEVSPEELEALESGAWEEVSPEEIDELEGVTPIEESVEDKNKPSTLMDYIQLAGHGLTQGLTDEAAGLGAYLGQLAGEEDIAIPKVKGKPIMTPEEFSEFQKQERDVAYTEGKQEQKDVIEGARGRQGLAGMATEMIAGGIPAGALLKAAPAAKSITGAVVKGIGSGAVGGGMYGLTEGDADIFTKGEWGKLADEVKDNVIGGAVLGGLISGGFKAGNRAVGALKDSLERIKPKLSAISYKLGKSGIKSNLENVSKLYFDKSKKFLNSLSDDLEKNSKELRGLEAKVGRKASEVIDDIDYTNMDDQIVDELRLEGVDSFIGDLMDVGVNVRDKFISALNKVEKSEINPNFTNQQKSAIKTLKFAAQQLQDKSLKELSGSDARKLQRTLADVLYINDSPAKITHAPLRKVLVDLERTTAKRLSEAVDKVAKQSGASENYLKAIRDNLKLQQYMRVKPIKAGYSSEEAVRKQIEKIMGFVESKGQLGKKERIIVNNMMDKMNPNLKKQFVELADEIGPLKKVLGITESPSAQVDPLQRRITSPISTLKHGVVDSMANLAGLTSRALSEESAVIGKAFNKVTPDQLQSMAKLAYEKSMPQVAKLIETVAGAKGTARIPQLYTLSKHPGFQKLVRETLKDEE
jgi:hypothetical protein